MRQKYVLGFLVLLIVGSSISIPLAFAALSVSVNEASYNRGDAVAITVSGATPLGKLMFQINSPTGDAIYVAEYITLSDGQLITQITIPSSWSYGSYSVQVKDDYTGNIVSDSFNLVQTTSPPPPLPSPVTQPPSADDVEDMDPDEAADALADADPGAAADVVEELDTDTAVDLFEEMDAEDAVEIFDELDADTAAEIISEMNTSTAAAIVEEVEAEAAAEIVEQMNTSAAATVIEEVEAEAAAEIFEQMNTSAAATVIEEVVVTAAADIMEQMNSSAAADVIEEVVVEAAAEIIVEMEGEAAAEVLVKANVTSAVLIVEVVVEASEEDAGELLDAAVTGNNAESFAEILNEMDEDSTAGALLASTPTSGGALVEEMAKKDVNKAAKRVEAAVKLRARELTPEAGAALLKQAATMLEAVSVESLVDLFITIVNLPDTPSTVADVLSVMSLDKVLQVVDAWVTAGYGKELGVVFDYLSEEVLSNIWTGMNVADRSTVYMYLSDEVTSVLPVVITPYPQAVINLKGGLAADPQLEAVIQTLDYVEWRVILNDVTAADLGEASLLILVQADSSLEYSDEELNVIKAWYEKGGKTIWVASDSDYGNDALRQSSANSVLEYLGSSMRFEGSSVEDPVSNGGAPYRVLGVSDNVDPEYEFLVSGVERGLFHGPGIIVGYENGEYVKLEESSIENVHVIMTTSENGVVVDNSEPSPEVHQAGDEGAFPVMVLEVDYENTGVIIATGDAPFGQYMGLYKPEMLRADRYGADVNPQQGGRLFENIVDYAVQYSAVLFNYENTVEASDDDISTLQSEISSLQGAKEGLEADVDTLEGEVSGLERDVSNLEEDVIGLDGQISDLGDEISDLTADVEAKKSAASSGQIYAIVLLIIGLAVGYFAEKMMNKVLISKV